MKKIVFLAALAAVALTGCTTDADRCTKSSNPGECNAWSDAGGDIDDYLIGGMMGYMLASRGGQTVIVQNPGYHGPQRRLHRPLLAENTQLRRKVERQKVELKRQQAANARKSEQLRAAKNGGSSFKSSSYRSSSRSSFSSSSRSGRR